MAEKITLKKEMETLLIPLFGRAKMTEQEVISDKYALETLKKIDYNWNKLHVQKKIQIFTAIRSGLIDDYSNYYLHNHKDSFVISLGSGLDSRYLRVNGYKEWIDLDFPEVAKLREKLLSAHNNHKTIGSSVIDFKWLNQIEFYDGNILIIAEGLLMYLEESQVKELFQRLIQKFPHAVFIFDSYSNATVKKIKWQSSLKKTGATICYGIDTPKEYWKKKIFWSDGYFACSIGEVSSANIQRYIETRG